MQHIASNDHTCCATCIGLSQLRNYYDFTSTSTLCYAWRVVMEGTPLYVDALHPEGWHALDVPPVPPRGAADVTVPLPWSALCRAMEDTRGPLGGTEEMFLELRMTLREATLYAPVVRDC